MSDGIIQTTLTADTQYEFRLYVTGSTPRSARAIQNMHRLCEQRLHGRYSLAIIDVYQDPESTREMQVIATPTLVKLTPGPVRRMIGDLSDEARLLAWLDLAPGAEPL